jgi:hypothetical protein
MPLTISILDETTSGETTVTNSIQVEDEATTLRDLIRQRIQWEVEVFNDSERVLFEGLVQPEESERTLNGYQLRQHRKLDWQKQYEKAIRSFQRNGFLVILDERQITDLDEKLQLSPTSEIHFLKLTPLVGG